MSQMRCMNCGQFANVRHICLDSAPKSINIPKGQKIRPQEVLTKSMLKTHEIISCLRLMNTAVGDPIEGGRSEYAQKQARFVLEQKFGSIDWNS